MGTKRICAALRCGASTSASAPVGTAHHVRHVQRPIVTCTAAAAAAAPPVAAAAAAAAAAGDGLEKADEADEHGDDGMLG